MQEDPRGNSTCNYDALLSTDLDGTDAVGFAAEFAGIFYGGSDNVFYDFEKDATFWSADGSDAFGCETYKGFVQPVYDLETGEYVENEDVPESAPAYGIRLYSKGADVCYDVFGGYFSVRCVKEKVACEENFATVKAPKMTNVCYDGRWYSEDYFPWKKERRDYLNTAKVYGEMTDSRNGKKYATIDIGPFTWMAENLNYADSSTMTNLKGNVRHFMSNPSQDVFVGLKYTWTGAMNIPGAYQTSGRCAKSLIPTFPSRCMSRELVPSGFFGSANDDSQVWQ